MMKFIKYVLTLSIFALYQIEGAMVKPTKKSIPLQRHQQFALYGAPEYVKLVSKDKKQYRISKKLARTLGELIETALIDKEASEIPISQVDSQILEIILNAYFDKDTFYEREPSYVLMQHHLNKDVNYKNINKLFQAADYLEIPINSDFIQLLANKYADIINDTVEAIFKNNKPLKVKMEMIDKALTLAHRLLDLPTPYREKIAKAYFLRHAVYSPNPIDTEINKILKVNPKYTFEEFERLGGMISNWGTLEEQFEKAKKDQNFPTMNAILKLKPDIKLGYRVYLE